jgi:hypothetical protein
MAYVIPTAEQDSEYHARRKLASGGSLDIYREYGMDRKLDASCYAAHQILRSLRHRLYPLLFGDLS